MIRSVSARVLLAPGCRVRGGDHLSDLDRIARRGFTAYSTCILDPAKRSRAACGDNGLRRISFTRLAELFVSTSTVTSILATTGGRRSESLVSGSGAIRKGWRRNAEEFAYSDERHRSDKEGGDHRRARCPDASRVWLRPVRGHSREDWPRKARSPDGYGLAGALWHGRRCVSPPAFHVTTTQLSRVTPLVVWTER